MRTPAGFLFHMTPTPRKRGRAAVADRARVMRRDNGLCQACLDRGRITAAVEVDHIIPLFKGGPDTDDNKRSLCKACHDDKTRDDKGYKASGACAADGIPTSKAHHWNR
jgi:5-methylcytosine-specific restriction protein A